MSGNTPADLKSLQKEGLVAYINFPEALKGKYQSFTQADIAALRRAGYKKAFLTVEEGVRRYIARLSHAENAPHA
jgi:ADP-L-glycero-D-manno-heptose 6-epimerase